MKSSHGKVIRKALTLTAAAAVFSLFYLIMYNILSRGSFLPGKDAWNNFLDYVCNFLPILALGACNYLVIFRLWRNTVVEKRLPVKFIADFAVGFIILLAVNFLYIFIAETLHLNPCVGWPGTVQHAADTRH